MLYLRLFSILFLIPFTNAFSTALEEALVPIPHKLVLPATDRHADIYDGEYGVVIAPSLSEKVYEAALCAQELLGGRSITPHVTVGQVRCLPENFPSWLQGLQTLAARAKPFTVEMVGKFVAHTPSGNTFWNVEEECARVYIDPLNAAFCAEDLTSLTLPMWQVTNNADADKTLVNQYGRDFNVPGHNRPHITVAYGRSDSDVIEALNTTLEELYHFVATHLTVVRIDSVGNVVDTVSTLPFGVN